MNKRIIIVLCIVVLIIQSSSAMGEIAYPFGLSAKMSRSTAEKVLSKQGFKVTIDPAINDWLRVDGAMLDNEPYEATIGFNKDSLLFVSIKAKLSDQQFFEFFCSGAYEKLLRVAIAKFGAPMGTLPEKNPSWPTQLWGSGNTVVSLNYFCSAQSKSSPLLHITDINTNIFPPKSR